MFWARFKIQHLWVWGILPSHVLKTAAQGKGHSRVPDYLFLWDPGAAHWAADILTRVDFALNMPQASDLPTPTTVKAASLACGSAFPGLLQPFLKGPEWSLVLARALLED